MGLTQFNLTIEEGILLHLLSFSSYQDEFEVPFNITQPGIAIALGIRRSHVSYVLKGLKLKGMVEEQTAHIKNLARKRKIYFLTQKGSEYAIKLLNNVGQKQIKLIEVSGKHKNLKLSEISKHFSKKIPIIQLINLTSSDYQIDSRLLIQDTKISDISAIAGTAEIKAVNFIENMPHTTRFVGRKDEIRIISDWIESDLPRIIVISGIPGIGKTTLAARIIDEYAKLSNKNLFWYRFHEWDTLRGTLSDLSEFLSQLGRNKLKSYLENQPTIQLQEIIKIFEADFQDQNILLVFDDSQKIGKNILQLFSIFTELLKKDDYAKLNILILTRSALKFYDRRSVAIKKLIAELELTGLSNIDSKELLNIEKLSETEFRKIFAFTEGHPLTLELIGIHMATESDEKASEFNLDGLFKEQHDINKYIRDEIFSRLTQTEKKLLDILSVFRYPVPSEAVFIDKDLDFESIDLLVNKSLIHQTKTGYDVHELIKEFLYRRLTPKVKVQYHEAAANYYTSEFDVENNLELEDLQATAHSALEAQYHFIRAGDYEKAGELAISHSDELIRKGYTEELSIILSELISKKISKRNWAEILIHKGHILTVNGAWDKALKCYQESLKINKDLKDNCGLARANNAVGVIFYRKGNLKKALEYYNHGLKFAEAENDDQNSSKIYSNMAMVHWGNSELMQAIKLMNKSLKLSEKLNDKQGIARAHNNLGIIYWEQRKLDQAIQSYKESLKLSHELGDKNTIASLYDNLGEVYRLKGENETAKKYYEKSLELSEELGFKWQIAEVYCNMGEMYKSSDAKKSKEYLNAALELYTTLGAKREIEKVKEIMIKD